jgi:hypothetical protein
MNLAQEMDYWNDIDCTESLSAFFAAMGMPLPEKGQFTRTRDKGALVFLDGPACVLRLIDRVLFPSIDHPLVLQPLFKKDVGVFRVEICPGILNPVRDEHLFASARKITDDGVLFPDFQEIRDDNFGYLPVEEPIAVVLDMDAIQDCRSAPTSSVPNTQGKIFAPLVEAFKEVWPDEAESVNASALHQAWKLCAEKKQEEILIASWQRPARYYGDFKNAKSGANNYAASWNFQA